MTDSPRLTVTDKPDAQRFEAHVAGETGRVHELHPARGKIIATHTEVHPEHEGEGLGSQLVRGVVAHLRADGRLLQPLCPYLSSWLRRYPDEADVVDRTAPH